MISAGRVLIMPKGEYDASTTYSMLDLVSYNGSSYVAKRITTGNLPTNTTYWQLSAYGGSAANMAANFAPIETTEYATRAYSQGDYLVNKDGQFCKVIVAIAIGDEINSTNTATTSVEEVIEDLTTYVDGLDAENAKITGKTAIATQTDLHTLGVGNYFKANTSVYVTNAPTGIDSVPTATFRLTVENINNASGDTTKILTLRTFDGKTYTQAYDGTTWSDWKTPGTAAYKDSTNAVTSGSTDLVESGAVASEFDTVNSSIQTLEDNDDAMLNVLGAKNLLPNKATAQTASGGHVRFDVNPNGSVTVNADGQQTGVATLALLTASGSNFVEMNYPNVIISGCPSGGAQETYSLQIQTSDDGGSTYNQYADYGDGVSVPASKYIKVYIRIASGAIVSNKTFYPMARPASVADNTYVPWAMTNRGLTNELTNEVNPQYVGVTLNAGTNGYTIGFPLPKDTKTAAITEISPLGVPTLTGLNIGATLSKKANGNVCMAYVGGDVTPTGASETLKSLATKYSTFAVVRITY